MLIDVQGYRYVLINIDAEGYRYVLINIDSYRYTMVMWTTTNTGNGSCRLCIDDYR